MHPQHMETTEQREGQIPYDITYIWNLKYGTKNLSTEKKIMDLENRLVGAKGEGEEWEGMGGTGSLG